MISNLRTSGLVVLLSAVIAPSLLARPLFAEENWPRFRGPNGSGISTAKTIPVQWEADGYRWKQPLPGTGNSSPVVWGKRLFVTSADADANKRFLLCFDTETGTELWRHEFEYQKYRLHKNNTFASNTPAVDSQRVYVLWQSREASPLIAFDHNGNEIWQYDLGPYLHGQGGGTSPIVHEELVVVCNDHAKGSFLLAVGRATGTERWKIPREGKRACYATPCVFEPMGKPAELVFSHCFEGISGVDPNTGQQNWQIDVFGKFPQRAVGSPIVAGGLIISNSGARGGERNVVAVRPYAKAANSQVEEVYRVSRTAPHVPTVLALDDLTFLWSDSGVVTCIETATGKKVWQERAGGEYFGSPICIDGKLYAVDLDGNVVVLAAHRQFKLLARNTLGEPSRATPAVGAGKLFIRTDAHIFAFGN